MPKVRFYTTAPECYDYGWTKVLVDDIATTDRGKSVRLVEVEDVFHAESQAARYGSGLEYVREEGEFRKDVEAGFMKMNPTPVHYYRCRFVLDDFFEWPLDKQEAFQQLLEIYEGVLHAENGGLRQRIEIRGDKELFDKIVQGFQQLGIGASEE